MDQCFLIYDQYFFNIHKDRLFLIILLLYK